VKAITLGQDVRYRGNSLERNTPGATHTNISKGQNATPPIINALKEASSSDQMGIGFVAIFSHGVPEEVFAKGGSGSGLKVTDLNQISDTMNAGDISFADGATIYLGGCNAGTCIGDDPETYPSLAQALADLTGTEVIAAVNDRVGPQNESDGNLIYTTEFPRNNQFNSFKRNQEPSPIGNTVDVNNLQERTNQRIMANLGRLIMNALR